MIRAATIAALSALVMLAALTVAEAPNMAAEAALVRIETETEAGTAQCSGSHLGDGIILTAAHCVDGAVFIEADGKRLSAAVLWADQAHDVALIYVRGYAAPSVRLACIAPAVGARVETLGIPWGHANVHGFGRIASTPRAFPGTRVSWALGQFTDAMVGSGMSGGMVLDVWGRQVGLIVGRAGGFGIVVPGDRICELMERAADG